MLAIRSTLMFIIICFCYRNVQAEIKDLQNCESQLNKYRKFVLQSILSFEDVCEVYNSKATPLADSSLPPQIAFFSRYQATDQKSEVWQFFKMLMAQFNDLEFANVIRDTVLERCRLKLQLQQQQQQRDEKRNSVVLGKKQRFHSWGGKRSGNELEQEHNDDAVLSY